MWPLQVTASWNKFSSEKWLEGGHCPQPLKSIPTNKPSASQEASQGPPRKPASVGEAGGKGRSRQYARGGHGSPGASRGKSRPGLRTRPEPHDFIPCMQLGLPGSSLPGSGVTERGKHLTAALFIWFSGRLLCSRPGVHSGQGRPLCSQLGSRWWGMLLAVCDLS